MTMKKISPIFVLLFILACNSLKKSDNPNISISSQQFEKEQIALGKRLFFDTRLSGNGTKSCANCHAPEFAFSDGYRRSMGIEADETLRNAPSLFNTNFYATLTWANPNVKNYEQQMRMPMFKQHPPELGLDSTNVSHFAWLEKDTFYQKQFPKAFPKQNQPFNYQYVIKAIAAYEKTLIALNSAYDDFRKGNKTAISEAAQRGEKLFFSERLQCGRCHPYPLFTDADQPNIYHNIGYFNEKDFGIYTITKNEADKGKFRTPTLRNIANTSPYMHDGGIERLEDVIKHFENTQNAEIQPFTLTKSERDDLISFLYTLNEK
jgi:cytochrome c peroxidase